ncbi:GntR family transcriptional regulator [Methylobacterium radiotolerans]|uniref:GntR family transcriptional regulator n=1 Tax=Methylobacterium radiotolerans TaxID=31998 RepID=UPI0007A5C583|nr:MULTISPECIES: GntR family transcriptional regulator [Methylobacterium]KZC00953.1 HTH-type transcriptional repressor RspR [Methylobacterium radiotolerans]MDE3748410.1 GntR family transcriptional regulator [Methylobacterium radiotolerans]ONF46571.1 GntR family transcriptional regulator [Methylobacterium radiotolerans]PVY95085.1 DNA-binding GntR family transcriptional regulator [Methylobacterium organophilum]
MLQPPETSLGLASIGQTASLREQAYDSIKQSILAMDLYDGSAQIRLHEHQIAQDLGISRTPVREALTLLEREGFVSTVPRRGLFVTRKTKREIVEMITVWAALEGMAAHAAARHAEDSDLRALGRAFEDFDISTLPDHLKAYDEANLDFHRTIVRLGGCGLMVEMTTNLFIHMRALRSAFLHRAGRLEDSMREHAAIIAALQARDADRAAVLVRDHALGLIAHVEAHWAWPEG